MHIPVLDKGFVTYVDHMGDDLTTVNAARISMNRRKDVFDEKDSELVTYLAGHQHTAPFRHSYVTMHIKAPIFVLRQWFKHRIASDFNEISGRYVDLSSADFYLPKQVRSQSNNVKQGSDGVLGHTDQVIAQLLFEETCLASLQKYNQLLGMGVAKEQARIVLPLALYTEVYWTASLQAIAHFCNLRLDGHAQWEIQEYAKAVQSITEPLFPECFPALLV